MTTQKRRVIYMSDEDWAQAKRQAEPFLMTISGYIRSLIVGGRIIPVSVRDEWDRIPAASAPMGTVTAQQERDAILRRVNRGNRP